MRFTMTIIWAVLISGVVSFVLTSMAGEPFNLTQMFVLSGFFVIVIFALGEGALKEE